LAEKLSWIEEFDRLTQEVEELFRQATKRFAMPSSEGCRMLAFYLLMLRQNPEKDRQKPAGQIKVVRDGNRFLRSLTAERQEIENALSLARQGRPALPWLREQEEILAQITETSQHIASLLPLLWPRYDPYRDPIKLLAERAKEAWRETNEGTAPLATKPDGPLCRFVFSALRKIGRGRSAAEVSEVLRGRRRNQRVGNSCN
jgi:hypothetical protein